MITFLPYPSVPKALEVLDRQRLGRQRLEAWQIYDAITNPSSIYANAVRGPAVRMWIGHERLLAIYYNECLMEWARRGYVNDKLQRLCLPKLQRMPDWWGGPIHASHRANLLRKLPEWYCRFGWREEPSDKYFWPV